MKEITAPLPDDVPAHAEAVAGLEDTSVKETVNRALIEAIDRRRHDTGFQTSLRRVVREDQELLERLAK